MTPYHPVVHHSAATNLEPLDVLGPDGRATGVVKARGKVHEDGDWHRAIHIWVVQQERYVLLQRRSRDKELEPLRLDVSVGGHLRAGETLLDALREAEEELGLELRPGQVEYLGTAVSERRYPDHEPPLLDREHQDVYVVRDDRPLQAYRLQASEVDTLYEVPLEKAIALFEAGEPVAAAGYDSMRRPSDALLYAADLPSQGGEVHLEALRRVAAYLRGEGAPDIARRPFGVYAPADV